VRLMGGEEGVVTGFVPPDKVQVELEGGQGFFLVLPTSQVRRVLPGVTVAAAVPAEPSNIRTPLQVCAMSECGVGTEGLCSEYTGDSSAGSSRATPASAWAIAAYAGATKGEFGEQDSVANESTLFSPPADPLSPLSVAFPPVSPMRPPPCEYVREAVHPPSTPPMSVEEIFPVGSWVDIFGLKRDTELNGQKAEVVGHRYTFVAGTLIEVMLPEPDDRVFALQPVNLMPTDPASEFSPTPEDSSDSEADEAVPADVASPAVTSPEATSPPPAPRALWGLKKTVSALRAHLGKPSPPSPSQVKTETPPRAVMPILAAAAAGRKESLPKEAFSTPPMGLLCLDAGSEC